MLVVVPVTARPLASVTNVRFNGTLDSGGDP